MARYTDANCRLCRREGQKLFLKGERCYSDKCAIVTRKGAVPGQHGQGRKKMRYRKEKFPSWTARSGQKEDFRLRTAATRKAEDKEILWNAGKAVQKFI